MLEAHAQNFGETAAAAAPAPNLSTPANALSLAARVRDLELRLAALEKRLAYDGGAAQSPPDDGKTGLTQSDEQRLATIEANIKRLLAEMPSGNKGSIGSRVTDPFEVVDSHGIVIMAVEGGDYTSDDLRFGVKIAGLNGTYMQLGSNVEGLTGLRVYGGGASGNKPMVALGLNNAGAAAMSILTVQGPVIKLLANAEHGGSASFYNAKGDIVTELGSNPKNGQGHALFANAAGNNLLVLGATTDHGDIQLIGAGKAFDLWSSLILGMIPGDPFMP